MSQLIKIAANGRLVLPKSARAALGLEDAGVVALSIEGDEVRLSSIRAGVKRAQALYRKYVSDDYTVDDFLRERREEAARDETKG